MQARCGDPRQGGAVSVGPIWHACIAIRPAKHRSADNSAEEADRIEINRAASACSAAIFPPHIFAENGPFVFVKSQCRA